MGILLHSSAFCSCWEYSWTISKYAEYYPYLFRRTHLESAIYFLAGFTAVTQLTIDFKPVGDDPPLDFGVIVESCPHLETLVVTKLRDHFGSLAEATKLQKVDITFLKTDLIEMSFFYADELPANSAQSLTSLGINICAEDDEESLTLDRFDSYVNLTEFKTMDLTSPLCKVLTCGKFTLTSLDVSCWSEDRDPSAEALLSIFHAPSLMYLRHLAFNFRRTNSDLGLAEEDELVSAIANLRHLETLDLKMTCYTSWFKRFARLRHLKAIFVILWEIWFDDDLEGKVP